LFAGAAELEGVLAASRSFFCRSALSCSTVGTFLVSPVGQGSLWYVTDPFLEHLKTSVAASRVKGAIKAAIMLAKTQDLNILNHRNSQWWEAGACSVRQGS
jgi:hypothetical protein